MEIIAFSSSFRDSATIDIINNDMKFVAIVVLVCMAYMSAHMKSIFLGVFSLINVFMSIPIGLCLYTLVFKVSYFSSIHLAVVILVIGIGADDLLVFHEQWINSFRIQAL